MNPMLVLVGKLAPCMEAFYHFIHEQYFIRVSWRLYPSEASLQPVPPAINSISHLFTIPLYTGLTMFWFIIPRVHQVHRVLLVIQAPVV